MPELGSKVSRGSTYNYKRFSPGNYELGHFPGPKAGEIASFDYTFHDLDGREVQLADYKGKWLVLESGSLTCPMYVKNVKPFAKLSKEFPDVEWLVIYVREAHPGSRLNPPDSIDDKIAYAKRNRDDYSETRKIVVDSVDGRWHHDWGLLPNVVYVISPEGKVIYRADWSFSKNVERVLNNRDKIDTNEHIVVFGAAPWITFPVTMKGGWDAIYDIVIALVRLIWMHVLVDVKSWFNRGKPTAKPRDSR
jgi:hypothetical protein